MSSTSAQATVAVPRNNFIGLIKTMRLRQWVKNVIVYAALVFDGKLFDPELFLKTTGIFLAFCLLSSSVYILNDLVDMEKDRQHPRKRARPLASGQLDPRVAAGAAAVLAIVAIAGAFALSFWAGVILLVYLAQNFAYSFWLKNIVIIDVMVLAFGFLLRVMAGVAVVQVDNFSPWLYVCVTLLALFLGFGKRRQEIVLLEEGAGNHRSSLLEYNLPLLDQIIGMVVTATLVAYTFYSFDATTALAHSRMLLTVPFVFYFLTRYLYLVHVKHLGGAPDELLLEDRPLLINSVLWAVSVVLLIYVWK
ncbi:MAG: decaprenyl-phosphate phosphoribosyltransferase [Caldilinea sp.]|nr:decaprenyl-phosphate phosphoribosyltransferase [Caldilineaceae bacterium]MCO5211595.1 decaprenyl-phosphate phosphoribosyltransferase [Caldilinea sp.]MCB9115286.1 decaprenyl-phosphate phosphoribosyltransferase [Caldilineaceae bacterium]MCB9119448.1 decaprenyl-phosphate phosphoribosyltransferase [Caldilineaceae bacterium]MCB9125521.1 decaprenyl-phosphate phosphoribosyltransferase [Caldilineaceae bacterium]